MEGSGLMKSHPACYGLHQHLSKHTMAAAGLSISFHHAAALLPNNSSSMGSSTHDGAVAALITWHLGSSSMQLIL
jgi:hypothetical protein